MSVRYEISIDPAFSIVEHVSLAVSVQRAHVEYGKSFPVIIFFSASSAAHSSSICIVAVTHGVSSVVTVDVSVVVVGNVIARTLAMKRSSICATTSREAMVCLSFDVVC